MSRQHEAEAEAAETALRTTTREGAEAAPGLLAAAPPTRPISALHAISLQRAVGNRATSAVLGASRAVQRLLPEDLDTSHTPAPGQDPAVGTATGSGSAGGTPAPPSGPPPSGSPSTASTTIAPPTTAQPATTTPSATASTTTTLSATAPPAAARPASTAPPAQPNPQPPMPEIVHPTVPPPAQRPDVGTTPDPETARSGISWDDVNLKNITTYGRPALELARIVPGWGMIAGAAADGIAMINDLEAVPPGDYPLTTGLIGLRDAGALVSGALGHLLYVDQLVQDGLAGTVVFIEVTPLTAEVNESLSGIKAAMDGALVFLDLAVMIGADWNKSKTADPAAAAAWQGIIDGAAANMLGDAFSTIMDLISLASAGVANTGPAAEGARFFGTAASLARAWKGVILSWVQSAWNIWGGGVMSGPTPAPAQRIEAPGGGAALLAGAYEAAAGILDAESLAGRAAYSLVDGGIAELEDEAARQFAEINAICAELSGGRSLFQVIQDSAGQGIAKMREEIASLHALQSGATDGHANAVQVRAAVDAAIAQVTALQMPQVHVPQVQLGDGVLAEAAGAVINAGASVVDSGLQLAVDGVRSALNTAKAEAMGPLQTVGANADEAGEFLATAARIAAQQTGLLEGRVGHFEQGLAQCSGFEDAINLLVGGFADLAGAPRLTVQDLRDVWASVPGLFDRIDTLAGDLHRRAATASAGGPDGGTAGGADGPGADLPMPPDAGGSSGGGGSSDGW